MSLFGSIGKSITHAPGINMINSFLHPENAYKKAEQANTQGWNEAKGYETPYWQQGQDQYGRINEAENNLLHPEELYNKWAGNYQQSPYAQQLLNQNLQSGQEAASAMGLGGSSGALQNIQQGAGNIVNQDRQSYLNDIMDKYMKGIGIGQGIYGTGAQTAANLGQQANAYGQNQAGLEYGRQAAPGQLGGQIAGLVANAYAPGSGAAFTGGNKFNQ